MTICRFGHQVLFQCFFDPVTKDPLLIKATIRSKEMPLHQTLVFICSYKGELIRPLIDRPRQRKRKGGDHHCQMIVKCNKSWFSPTVYDQSTLGQCYHILKKLWSLKEIKVSLKAEKPLLFISEFKTLSGRFNMGFPNMWWTLYVQISKHSGNYSLHPKQPLTNAFCQI